MRIISSRPLTATRLPAYLQKRILELKPRKTQVEIASEAGFKQRTMLANIKSGVNKLPLDRVPGLAKALECDPAFLFLMALEQLEGETTDLTIKSIFETVVTQNEATWIAEIRKLSGNSDPRLTTKAERALKEIFGR